MVADVLRRIVDRRKERLLREGYTQGLSIPAARPREVPVRPFPTPLICEFKRRSPSRGALAGDADPVTRVGTYRDAGVQSVSVLTEQDHFHGSLADLVAVKRAFPDLAVLRKDFLFTEEDIEVSWRAGADAVLLIASILSPETLVALTAAATARGLAALVEVHDRAELEKVRELKPRLVGINSRDLRTFRVDLLSPLSLARAIDWDARLVFESGIFHREDVLLANDGGFSSLLVGEAVVTNPERIRALQGALRSVPSELRRGREDRSDGSRSSFWPTIAVRREKIDRSETHGESPTRSDRVGPRVVRNGGDGAAYAPLVKICGITNREDAERARDLGADVLGLVYARSVRSARRGLAAELARDIGVPLVGVVVEPDESGDGDAENASLLVEALRDLSAGHLSALQLHGGAGPEKALDYGWPYYKAVRPATSDEARAAVLAARGPRLLVDAYHPALAGGTGVPVGELILDAVAEALQERPHGALWLAGGLGAETVYDAIVRRRPELIDASSRLEAEPGKKDHEAMERFFAAVTEAAIHVRRTQKERAT